MQNPFGRSDLMFNSPVQILEMKKALDPIAT
jgi:hypothetical protein